MFGSKPYAGLTVFETVPPFWGWTFSGINSLRNPPCPFLQIPVHTAQKNYDGTPTLNLRIGKWIIKKENAVKEIVSISGDLCARNLNLFINLFISVTSIQCKAKVTTNFRGKLINPFAETFEIFITCNEGNLQWVDTLNSKYFSSSGLMLISNNIRQIAQGVIILYN